MLIWLIRHGRTNLNAEGRMQGRTDEPLNEEGIQQAQLAAQWIAKWSGGVQFDRVYASPLDRAIHTASIVSGWDREDIVKDERLLEMDFGPYELKKYGAMGIPMTLYWMLPEVFPAPKGVEPVPELAKRSASFLKEVEREKDTLKNVLIAAHGEILRGLTGYLLDRKSGMAWRSPYKNCEVRVFEWDGKYHSCVAQYRLNK